MQAYRLRFCGFRIEAHQTLEGCEPEDAIRGLVDADDHFA